MSIDLVMLLEAVVDEPSFVAFLEALSDDFAMSCEIEAEEPSAPYGPLALGWENGSVDAVLERAAAWATDTRDNPSLNPLGQTPWRRCAEIIFAGKYYE